MMRLLASLKFCGKLLILQFVQGAQNINKVLYTKMINITKETLHIKLDLMLYLDATCPVGKFNTLQNCQYPNPNCALLTNDAFVSLKFCGKAAHLAVCSGCPEYH